MGMIRISLVLSAMLLSCLPQAKAESAATDFYAAAVANDDRPAADVARDAGRKPAEVLAFFGIEPGMSVLDMFSGGGYYSELLAYVVGDQGHVVAHSNKAYLKFVGEEFVARYAGGRLPNVDILMAENNKLKLDEDQFDAIFLGLSFHDTYWANPEGGWPALDRDKLFGTLFMALKPGGVLGVTDHYAAKGSGATAVPALHRIEKSVAIADLEAAGFELVAESDLLRNPDDDHSKSVFVVGFELVAESDLLRNPDDDHSKSVFAPDIRGKSDRFVLKFRKPR